MKREEIFNKALELFNTDEYPFIASIEGENLVLKWNWKNALLVGTDATIRKEQEEFKCIVSIIDDKKYKITDISSSSSVSAGMGGISLNKSGFVGKQMSINKEISFGKNKNTNEVGVVTFDFNSKKIHEPLKQFLESCGLKKKGLF